MLLHCRWGDLAQRDDCDGVNDNQAKRRESARQAHHQQHGQHQLASSAQCSGHNGRQNGHFLFVSKEGHSYAPVAQLGQPRQEKHLRHV